VPTLERVNELMDSRVNKFYSFLCPSEALLERRRTVNK